MRNRWWCHLLISMLALSACDGGQPEDPASPAAGSIRGVIRLAPGVQAPESGTLFVIARGAGMGPPLAVRRLALGSFPLSFEIGPADSHAGSRFEGPIFLGARVDEDGEVATRGSDPLAAVASRVVNPGETGIELVLVPNTPPARPGGLEALP